MEDYLRKEVLCGVVEQLMEDVHSSQARPHSAGERIPCLEDLKRTKPGTRQRR